MPEGPESHITPQNRWVWEFLTSGASVGIANVVTQPLDVLKVRLQLQKVAAEGKPLPLGLLGTTRRIVHEEGFLALYRGLGPAVLRGLTYGGVRLGAYGPIQRLLGAEEGRKPQVVRSMVSGAASGVFAAAIANPLDLVKTRLQSAEGRSHQSSLGVVLHVVRTHGILGLWLGTGPSMARAGILTAAQFSTYDQCKRRLMKATSMADGIIIQLATSLISGLATTTLVAPADRIKTLVFAGDGTQRRGLRQVVSGIWKQEGWAGFFRGWTAQYLRLGPQTTVIFMVMEKLRRLTGLEAL